MIISKTHLNITAEYYLSLIMIDIATGKTDVSDHALRRMKKECVVELFRETESKLHGATAGHNMFESAVLTEIQELNDKNDDLLIQEAMNQKTTS